MKAAIFIIVTLCVTTGYSAILRRATTEYPCNQKVYDQLYREISLEAGKGEVRAETFKARAATLEILRQLCRGQKSTFEGGAR